MARAPSPALYPCHPERARPEHSEASANEGPPRFFLRRCCSQEFLQLSSDIDFASKDHMLLGALLSHSAFGWRSASALPHPPSTPVIPSEREPSVARRARTRDPCIVCIAAAVSMSFLRPSSETVFGEALNSPGRKPGERSGISEAKCRSLLGFAHLSLSRRRSAARGHSA